MLPAQNRPAASQAPSFIRQRLFDPSGVATTSTSACPGRQVAKPSRTASTRPPPSRNPTAPTWRSSVSATVSRCATGSKRWTSPRSMSTQYRQPSPASHTGPSPRTAALASTRSADQTSTTLSLPRRSWALQSQVLRAWSSEEWFTGTWSPSPEAPAASVQRPSVRSVRQGLGRLARRRRGGE